jgi:putative DNA methylase
VALPLDAINQASAREKSIRHGHPSTLHLWWARRPLAAARAVIFAQMVDDPSARPEEFPTKEAQDRERARLFRIIEDLVKWENTTNEEVLARARNEIWKSWRRTCHDHRDHPRASELFDPDKLPAFHDPFAGGGALPLEAQRLGLEAYASDLNPVAVLINKAMIEIPPRFAGQPPVNPQARNEKSLIARTWKGAQGLAEDVRYYGQWMRDEAEKRIGHLYPKIEVTAEMAQERPDLKPLVGKKLTVIAWLWARTVKSPNPAFAHVEVPLASTFMLSTKAGKEAYVEPVIEHGGYRFTVKVGKPKDAEAAKNGTKLARGANFRCLMSGTPIAGDYIKAEGKAGRMGARLMAIVAEGERGRVYLAPTPEHEAAAGAAKPTWKPETPLAPDPRALWTPPYGLTTYGDLFTPRQLVALTTFSDLVGEAMAKVKADYLGASLGTRASCPRNDEEDASAEDARAGRPRSQVPLRDGGTSAQAYDEEDATTPPGASLGARASCPRSDDQEPTAVRPHAPWHRTHLPHFEAGEVAQHITFRLADSLPVEVLRRWEEELGRLTDAEREVERRRRIEDYLDRGHGACYLRDPRIAQMVVDALCHFDGSRYRLHEWVVMPNHVHVLITPLLGHSLSSILHSWKSYTAKEINRVLGRSGPLWQEDYFDRVIRDERHWAAAVAYIGNNPVKAGLCTRPEEWPFGSRGASNLGTRASSLGARASCPGNEHLGTRASCPRNDEDAREEDTRAGRPRSQVPLRDGGTGATAYAEAVGVYWGFAISKLADRGSSICTWFTERDSTRNTFARQSIPMTWDYAELNTLLDGTGSFLGAVEWTAESIEGVAAGYGSSFGASNQVDATSQVVSRGKLVSTDPPYYDNIGYADLSDFFYVWLRRSLKDVFPDLFATLATPKAEELVASPYRHGSKEKAEAFFLDGMTQAMHCLAEQVHPAFPVTIYYAFKQSESETDAGTASTGWETFLDAVIRAGFAISGTWPMRTELGNRMTGRDTNALASSIVLVCRRRPANAATATRREFVNALKAELPAALAALQKANIAPVDLAQAAIGPGMAVYTRYARVLDAEGNPVTVREALALINQVLDETLAEQEGDFDADSRWALAWFEQHGFSEGEFGVAETLSKAKNTSVGGMVEAGIVESKRGKVRLLVPDELPTDWDPVTDPRLTVWEMVHHLIRVLESGGENAAATLLAKLGSRAEIARELAYRLYTVAERKKRAQEALRYNALVQSWPEITRLARESGTRRAEQTTLFGQD